MSEPRWKKRANRVASRLRAVGGHLELADDDVLVFRPSPLERKMNETEWTLPLGDVTGFRASSLSLRDAFAGGLRPRLALDVRHPDGRRDTHLFIVPDPKAAAAELLALAAAAAVADDEA